MSARIRIKICGITRREDLRAAIDSGADAVGFVVGFEKSPRNITISKAAELRRMVPVFVDAVLVTRGDTENIAMLCSYICPDAIQIYGEIDVSTIRERFPGVKVIKPIDPSRISAEEVKRLAEPFDAILLDSSGKELPGGTGTTHNWQLSAEVVRNSGRPAILAGGLTPENVREAIMTVRPYGVDVSSGVEASPGIKDHGKIRKFVERVIDTLGSS